MQAQWSKRKRPLIIAAVAAVAALAAIGSWIFADNHASGAKPLSQNVGTAAVAPVAQASASSRIASKSVPNTPARHAAAATPLPPPGTPLAKIYDELKARADAGDATAATRLYHDVHRCARVRAILRDVPRFAAAILDEDTAGQSADRLLKHEQFLASLSVEIDKARASADQCEDLSDEQLHVNPAALRAAQLGDIAASNCYLGASPFLESGLLDHPEWLVEFKQNGMAIANAAIEKGDWLMVAQLGNAYAQTFSSSLLAQLAGRDPAKAYAFLQLRRLGAGSDDATRFFDKALAQARQELSPAAITAADDWAQDMFTHYFAANPINTVVHNMNVCQDADD
jgi:hypothetical protein